MLASADWAAVGAIAGVVAAAMVIGGAVVRTAKDRMEGSRSQKTRLDRLEIRLFGLPADPVSGAPKVDGEFDHINQRLDAILAGVQNGNGHG